MGFPSPELDLHTTAIHEAAHCVAALQVGLNVESVTIVDTPEHRGMCVLDDRDCPLDKMPSRSPQQLRCLEALATMDLAADLAEERFMAAHGFCRHDEHGCPYADGEGYKYGEHYRATVDRAAIWFSQFEKLKGCLWEDYLDDLFSRARGIIDDPCTWRQIEALAAALLKQQTLSGSEVGFVLAKASLQKRE